MCHVLCLCAYTSCTRFRCFDSRLIVRCAQWNVVYLFGVEMSLHDDTCSSLIKAAELVFEDCGVTFDHPNNEPFISIEDYKNHADEVWQEIREKARSKFGF